MTASHHPAAPPDAEAIRGLVAEVLRRIAETTGGRSAATAVPVVVSRPLPSPQPPATKTLTAGVVSLAVLEKLPPGTTRVIVPAAAVITPSARDHARERGLEITRTVPGVTPEATRPFLVAQADSPTAAATAAVIARTIPGALRIPASGLSDVITALATHASRDGARGVLFTGRTGVAAVLANRSASLRAVTGRDAPAVAAAATETAANLLIVDPASLPAPVLGRLVAEFASRPEAVPPPELAQAPDGCGCQGQGH